MAFTKSRFFFTSLLILVTVLGVSAGGTVYKVGDSQGWTLNVNYELWASSKTFQVGDSLLFEYDNGFHDLTQVTHDDFELCDASKPITKYQTGFDTITLTKPGIQYFICGTPSHCNIGQKLQVHVMPASLGPVVAPVPGPVRSPSSSSSPAPSSVDNAPQYHMGPSPAPVSASPAHVSSASNSTAWILLCDIKAMAVCKSVCLNRLY